MIGITLEDIDNEFKRIKQGNLNGYSCGYYWNECILYFQWKEFYKKELQLWNDNPMYKNLPLQSWIYNNRLKYIGKSHVDLTFREILRAFKITGIHIGNSFHCPFWIQQFIKDYNIQSIYDPCGGWGHRLIGAWNIKYIYNDINPVTFKNCIEMSKYFNLNNSFYNQDAAFLTPHEDYEAVFTCPPYFNIEIYSEQGAENKSYSEFKNWWRQLIKSSCNNSKCKYFAFIINHTYKQDMENICIELGLTKLQEIIVGKQQYSHLVKNKNTHKGEYLLIFNVR